MHFQTQFKFVKLFLTVFESPITKHLQFNHGGFNKIHNTKGTELKMEKFRTHI
ncbi:CLUMA_CG004512, isoform A [Clunio marinus]|uniref:CLUMA_CG004512, isoform A n=1 Tax=Clunio marinus TaxID=568069 RepID=A0A1J1HWD1_9DIPT|nr:CLUMA_CG004512, isoform A [Clunio marinus]